MTKTELLSAVSALPDDGNFIVEVEYELGRFQTGPMWTHYHTGRFSMRIDGLSPSVAAAAEEKIRSEAGRLGCAELKELIP